jgi:hypothetical protein
LAGDLPADWRLKIRKKRRLDLWQYRGVAAASDGEESSAPATFCRSGAFSIASMRVFERRDLIAAGRRRRFDSLGETAAPLADFDSAAPARANFTAKLVLSIWRRLLARAGPPKSASVRLAPRHS